MSQRKTPISDLFGVPADLSERADQPQSAVSSEPRNPGGAVGWVVVLLLAAILAFLAIDRFGDGKKTSPDDGKDDQEQIEPKPNPVVVGKTLIFVHERNPQPIEHDLLLREMPKFCADRKLQFRAFDDDLTDEPLPELKSFAKSKGIEPPFVVLTDGNDKPARVIKWPTDIAGLGDLFK